MALRAGLCVGMSGGNTDVKMNDRLPILSATHENEECQRACVPKDPLRKARALRRVIRITQVAQAQTNGYFGGYIGKRQKLGRLETKKCVDKMYKLRERQHGKSEFEQQRSVSGRMITDIEMNGTLRGAVEEFNLCMNLRANDVFFAECIRTFSTVHVDAQQWMHRLEVELERVGEMLVSIYIPPTKKPHMRTNRSKAPLVDMYGFRPLQHPFAYLSAFEFLQYWEAKALAPPWEDERTEWTPEGNNVKQKKEFKAGKI